MIERKNTIKLIHILGFFLCLDFWGLFLLFSPLLEPRFQEVEDVRSVAR
jgi:hypothetical protein